VKVRRNTAWVMALFRFAVDRNVIAVDLIAIADRAQPHLAGVNGRLDVGHVRQPVLDTGGEDDPPGDAAALAVTHAEALDMRLDVLDLAVLQACAVASGLFAQPGQQVVAADARWKARVVARPRYPRGAAAAGIDHQTAASEARQVQRGGEAGGTAADDQAVGHGGLRVRLLEGHGVGRWRVVASRRGA